MDMDGRARQDGQDGGDYWILVETNALHLPAQGRVHPVNPVHPVARFFGSGAEYFRDVPGSKS
jgi:hypothetical protein